jgi:hypothetical protein
MGFWSSFDQVGPLLPYSMLICRVPSNQQRCFACICCACLPCDRAWQVILDQEDVYNGIGEQRQNWDKMQAFITANCELLQKTRAAEARKQQREMREKTRRSFMKCTNCWLYTRRGNTSCAMCNTRFCSDCAAPYSGEFGLRSNDDRSAHEPSCPSYLQPASGAEPIYARRRARTQLTFCVKLAQSLHLFSDFQSSNLSGISALRCLLGTVPLRCV